MPSIQDLYNLPELSFVESDLPAKVAKMITDYEAAYKSSTGKTIKLFDGDPVRIFLYTQALKQYQLELLIDQAAKQNYLRYSNDEYLDHLGATRTSTLRLGTQKALTTMRFTLSTTFEEAKIIPAGTRVTPGDNLFFITTSNFEVDIGELTADAVFECTEAGIIGNGYVPGQIETLVDPIPYVASVTNLTESQGGADIESNDNFRERIFMSPEGFAVAGPTEAYVARTKEYSQAIIDVAPRTPNPGEVDIRFILTDGEIPNSTIIDEVFAFLDDRTKRPLTDNLTVDAPDVVNYDIELTYYIDSNNLSIATQIQAAVNTAINNFVLWQKTKIGRDINPSQLINMIMDAGVKRVVVTAPVFTVLEAYELGVADEIDIIYGGLEVA